MPTCRGCGEPIRFVTMRDTRKAMPCEVEPSKFGNIVVEADGLAVKLGRLDAIHYTGEKLMPHWKSCPDAAEFRKKLYPGVSRAEDKADNREKA